MRSIEGDHGIGRCSGRTIIRRFQDIQICAGTRSGHDSIKTVGVQLQGFLGGGERWRHEG